MLIVCLWKNPLIQLEIGQAPDLHNARSHDQIEITLFG